MQWCVLAYLILTTASWHGGQQVKTTWWWFLWWIYTRFWYHLYFHWHFTISLAITEEGCLSICTDWLWVGVKAFEVACYVAYLQYQYKLSLGLPIPRNISKWGVTFEGVNATWDPVPKANRYRVFAIPTIAKEEKEYVSSLHIKIFYCSMIFLPV